MPVNISDDVYNFGVKNHFDKTLINVITITLKITQQMADKKKEFCILQCIKQILVIKLPKRNGKLFDFKNKKLDTYPEHYWTISQIV